VFLRFIQHLQQRTGKERREGEREERRKGEKKAYEE